MLTRLQFDQETLQKRLLDFLRRKGAQDIPDASLIAHLEKGNEGDCQGFLLTWAIDQNWYEETARELTIWNQSRWDEEWDAIEQITDEAEKEYLLANRSAREKRFELFLNGVIVNQSRASTAPDFFIDNQNPDTAQEQHSKTLQLDIVGTDGQIKTIQESERLYIPSDPKLWEELLKNLQDTLEADQTVMLAQLCAVNSSTPNGRHVVGLKKQDGILTFFDANYSKGVSQAFDPNNPRELAAAITPDYVIKGIDTSVISFSQASNLEHPIDILKKTMDNEEKKRNELDDDDKETIKIILDTLKINPDVNILESFKMNMKILNALIDMGSVFNVSSTSINTNKIAPPETSAGTSSAFFQPYQDQSDHDLTQKRKDHP